MDTSKLKGIRLLIVEDNKENAFCYKMILKSYYIEVENVSSGEEAISILKVKIFDIIFMDIRLPGIDGYQTTKMIRAIPSLIDIPIIAITAQAMPKDKEKSLEAGANEYLFNPFDYKDLIKKIINLL